MTCHTQCHATVCVSQRPCWHATPYVVRSCALSKANCDDGMPRPTSSDHVFIPMAITACNTRHIPTLCAAQGR
ncbi:hypothetical protein EJD97_003530 [Solanum chilense]|uniref:Uncharacterized protein n=1 Tax=Solanum chilense TaxID=4083 RepID=A0A6N2AL24_SOLCI|nr:hypothetical protein EJD97_003530 [Solanum chilense]